MSNTSVVNEYIKIVGINKTTLDTTNTIVKIETVNIKPLIVLSELAFVKAYFKNKTINSYIPSSDPCFESLNQFVIILKDGDNTIQYQIQFELVNNTNLPITVARMPLNCEILRIEYTLTYIALHCNTGIYLYTSRLDNSLIRDMYKHGKALLEIVNILVTNKARKHIRDININDSNDIVGQVISHITRDNTWQRATTVNKSGTLIKYQYPTLNSLQRVVAFELISFVRDNTRLHNRLISMIDSETGMDIDFADACNDYMDLLDINELKETLYNAPKGLANNLYGILINDTTLTRWQRYNVADYCLINTTLLDNCLNSKAINNYIDTRTAMRDIKKDTKNSLLNLKNIKGY